MCGWSEPCLQAVAATLLGRLPAKLAGSTGHLVMYHSSLSTLAPLPRSYEMAAAEEADLAKLEWQSLVVDEGHRLKNKEVGRLHACSARCTVPRARVLLQRCQTRD